MIVPSKNITEGHVFLALSKFSMPERNSQSRPAVHNIECTYMQAFPNAVIKMPNSKGFL